MGNRNTLIDNLDALLCPNVPRVDEIVCIKRVQMNIEDPKSLKKHIIPHLHFMVYQRKTEDTNRSTAYMCTCLEFGIFHVLSIDVETSIDVAREISKLILETANLVAEHIRMNTLELGNNAIIAQLQSDFMNDFWKAYRLYTLLEEASVTSEEIAAYKSGVKLR